MAFGVDVEVANLSLEAITKLEFCAKQGNLGKEAGCHNYMQWRKVMNICVLACFSINYSFLLRTKQADGNVTH